MKLNIERAPTKEWMDIASKGMRESKRKGFWKNVYKKVAVPARSSASVDINKIGKYSKENDLVVVPGKVLGKGKMAHKVQISAIEYSESAEKALRDSGCKIIGIKELYELVNNEKAKIDIIV
jgi:large subunit ribosomal protein L18e